MIYAVLLLSQLALTNYSVTVDPVQLDYLYEQCSRELEIPATITLDTLTAECTLSFRGGMSLYLPKKSWHIRLNEENSFPGGEHILLNAQSVDAALMRNTLGHLLTRELGSPAPLTEFVTLSINGTNMGVYEHIERIDRRFFERNGFGYGPIFKSICPMGRLVCHYSDYSGTYSFEPKIDSEPYRNQLLELFESCFRGDVSTLETGEFLTLFAVKAAIANRDAVIKNFYLHLWQGSWHIYPWDMDASFGNTPGEYIPGWEEGSALDDIRRSGATRSLFESRDNVQMFNDLIAASSVVMGEKFPGVIDSIRLEIREDLGEDPYYEYSAFQFDSICTVLSNDIEARAIFLTDLYLADSASTIESYEISSSLDLGHQLNFNMVIEGGDPSGVVILLSIDGQEEEMHFLPEDDDNEYEFCRNIPEGTYSVRMVFGPRMKPRDFPVFFPSWSFKNYQEITVPAPAARVSLAPLEPEFFAPGFPLWCGENLWVLPVTNTADFVQDLSLCVFRIGAPAGTIFFPESILVGSGESFYLSNNAALAEDYFSGQIFGDAGTPYPSNTPLILDDPSWHEMYCWSIENGDSIPIPSPWIIPSEISKGDASDWVELCNPTETVADMSGWYLMDSEMNTSVFPEGTLLEPNQLMVVWEESPPLIVNPLQLDFSLNSKTDSLKLFNRLGTQIFGMGWDDCWPGNSTGIIYLESPECCIRFHHNWREAAYPGTPGEANPGWVGFCDYTNLQLVSPNPSNGIFSIVYQSSSEPLEAILYDLSGRVVSRLDLQGAKSGTLNADFSSILSSGIYFVYLRSSTGMDSVRFTVLRGD